MEERKSIRKYLESFDKGAFNSKDVNTQINAGWYDWFCKDNSLRNKTYSLTAKLKKIVDSPKINQDKMYVFFKNNCPCVGSLYDDFRICDIKTHDVIYTITPKSGFKTKSGAAEVWGKENDFKEPIVIGEWNDIMTFFFGVDKKEKAKERKLEREAKLKEKEEEKKFKDNNKIISYISSRTKEELCKMFVEAKGKDLTRWAKDLKIIK